ncbi:phosphatidylinositol synthase [Pelomyxa schiedti]|nr:phosphatidylinositol synthase [Pelomyxa schiedti]
MEGNVYLYYPNLVGYARITLNLIGFWVGFRCPLTFLFCYMASALMDMLDGHLARAYNQCTRFGAVLDMITDRTGTAMLLMILCVWYPSWTYYFQFYVFVDICSHWTQMYSSLFRRIDSHKTCTHPVLNWYYQKRNLGLLCFGNEAFYLCLYCLHWGTEEGLLGIPIVHKAVYAFTLICLPLAVAKLAIAIVQWQVACQEIVGEEITQARKVAPKRKH